MFSNKKLKPIVTEYFSEAENQTFLLFLLRNLILLNSTHYLLMNIPNK